MLLIADKGRFTPLFYCPTSRPSQCMQLCSRNSDQNCQACWEQRLAILSTSHFLWENVWGWWHWWWHVRDRRRPDGRGWTQTTSPTSRQDHDKQTPLQTSRQRCGQANVEERNKYKATSPYSQKISTAKYRWQNLDDCVNEQQQTSKRSNPFRLIKNGRLSSPCPRQTHQIPPW